MTKTPALPISILLIFPTHHQCMIFMWWIHISVLLHMQPESPQTHNCISIFPKKQFSVDTKHILTCIPFICISSTDNNPIIYLQAVTESIVFSQQGLCFTWSGGISRTLSAVTLFTEPWQRDDSFYRSSMVHLQGFWGLARQHSLTENDE